MPLLCFRRIRLVPVLFRKHRYQKIPNSRRKKKTWTSDPFLTVRQGFIKQACKTTSSNSRSMAKHRRGYLVFWARQVFPRGYWSFVWEIRLRPVLHSITAIRFNQPEDVPDMALRDWVLRYWLHHRGITVGISSRVCNTQRTRDLTFCGSSAPVVRSSSNYS